MTRQSELTVEVDMSPLHLLFVAGSLTLPVDTPLDEAGKTDLQQFQGTWKAALILNDDGKPATPKELDDTTLVVKGNRFTLKSKDYTITGRFTIDPAVSPKAIDVLLDATDGDPTTKLLGIYRIDGETRKSCFALPNQPRPARFPDSPKGYLQFEWKQAAPESAARK
jgi:uncharacterized protein (TIGR03067 family)